MLKRKIQGLVGLVAAALLAGCTGSAGITARSYVDDKPRVDQKLEGGNQGYLAGTPAPVDESQRKKTRKIYVMEFTKEIPEEDIEINIPPRPPRPQSAPIPAAQPVRPEWAKPVVIPVIDEVKGPRAAGTVSFVDYTVEKGDTLQKISKKFYDSFSKWNKIYEVNKETIKNPNRIKEGLKLKIPME